jgi:hypothetical protein
MKPNPNLDFYLTKTTIMWYKNMQIEIVLGLEKLTKWKFWWKKDIEANQMRFLIKEIGGAKKVSLQEGAFWFVAKCLSFILKEKNLIFTSTKVTQLIVLLFIARRWKISIEWKSWLTYNMF